MVTTNHDSTDDQPKPTKVEIAKQQGAHLRGTIAQTLADQDQEHFADDDLQLLKFHGVYQQDDRDLRNQRRKDGLGKAYSFMIRIAIPGGILTPEQYLLIDDIAGRYGGGSLRLTTRQAIQLHGVLKSDLKQTMREINDALVTSLAACGDIPRNVMASPAPFDRPAYHAARQLTRELALELAPATGAYHEIWLDGEPASDTRHEEPFYGEAYLPRKFKLGVTVDGDNSLDLYAYDAGLIALTNDDDSVRGYNLIVGGGFGMTHNKPETIARLASEIAFVPPDRAVDAMRETVAIFRDHGNRTERRQARIKYLLEAWGLDRFRTELAQRLGTALAPPEPTASHWQHDFVGAHDQRDGQQFLGVFIENGRLTNHPDRDTRGAVRAIVERVRPGVRVTPMQSILFTDLEPGDVDTINAILREHGLATEDELSNARRYSMACVALPTCGLALAESERFLPSLIDDIETELERLGVADTPINIRMTGCPNGCARPYNADIGFVGRKPQKYHIYVGGGLAGDRLADLFAPEVHTDDLLPTLRPLLERYADERAEGETLGDFYQRVVTPERDAPRTVITGREEPTAHLVQLGIKP